MSTHTSFSNVCLCCASPPTRIQEVELSPSFPHPPFFLRLSHPSYSFSVPAAILLLPAPSTAATAALLLAPPDAAGVSTKPSTQGASKQATTKATSRSMATLTPLLRWANGMMMMTIDEDQRRGWSLSVEVVVLPRLLLKEKGRD